MAFEQLSNGGSPLQQRTSNRGPSVQVFHRLPELSSYLMLQHNGHTADLRRGISGPYQSCLAKPMSIVQLDSLDRGTVPTSCRLLSALPCHSVPTEPHSPVPICQPCLVPVHSHPTTTQPTYSHPVGASTIAARSEYPHGSEPPAFSHSSSPISPPPPTRVDLLISRKRKYNDSETENMLEVKYPRREAVNRIEFKPLPPTTSRRPGRHVRPQVGGRQFQSVQPLNKSDLNLVAASRSAILSASMPCNFEFNIPFLEISKENMLLKTNNSNVLRNSNGVLPDNHPTTFPTEQSPKEGYINVLEQAINQLSERFKEDAKEVEVDEIKENVEASGTSKKETTDGMTKESLDKAWLAVLDKVFGKSEDFSQERGKLAYSSAGTSGYPSEYYSEVDWTTSTLESDYVSSADHDVYQPTADTVEVDGFKEAGPEELSKVTDAKLQSNEHVCDSKLTPEVNISNSPRRSDFDLTEREHEGKNSSEVPKETVEDEDISDDEIRDEHEEEKATDADVETEFMSSAEHEKPKWNFLKPWLLKRSPPKKSIKPPRQNVESDTSSGKEGFATPTYQCSFPVSSDSEAAHGNSTPSHPRKPQPPFKSPEPVDPSFRGVTVQIRTKVEKNQVQLSIKGFFNCRKKSKRRSEHAIGQSPKSSSDSDSNSNNDVYRKRKRRSYQSGKQCASCKTKKTPLWRDAEDGTPLCNACGIRYKKYRVKCHSCWHIPRKDVKMNSTCINCGESLKLSAMRNPSKYWT